jgi:hypothetical protein
MGQRFSSGKYARAMCDRCGIEVKYLDLRDEWTGLKVCNDCWDPKTALEFPTNFPTDPEALRDPRPDNDMEASLGKITLDQDDLGTGFQMRKITVSLGKITVLIT